jgi:hypothetical protein
MVNHYIHVTERAADYKIMITVMKLFTTGPNRTYQTGLLKNQPEELSLKPWGISPEHTTILPFTQLRWEAQWITPGIFQTDLSYYNTGGNQRVNTTLKQLAYYVTMYSPLANGS